LEEGLNRSEGAVRASEERLRLVLDTAHEAFVSMDVGGIITDWNRAAEATFGWQAEEVIGRKLSLVLIPERYRIAYEGAFRRYLQTGQARMLNRRFEIEALHRYGHEIPVELSISPLGGDEFIMAVPEVDAVGARLTAERLATALTSDLTDVAGNAMSTSASIGVASFVGSEDVTADELVRRADEALYEAKRARRRRADHYKPVESGKPPTATTRRSRWAGR
jgi:PAS domain S-box-containing protein